MHSAHSPVAAPDRTQARVLIYRSELLPPSETFIAAQAGALQSFQPIYTGLKRRGEKGGGGVPLSAAAELLTENDRLPDKVRRFLYNRMGVAHSFVQRLKKWHPQLVHAHFAVDGCEALPLVRALDLPLVVTLHGYDVMMQDHAHAQTERGRSYLRARPALWTRAALFLCVSEAVRTKAIERGFPESKLVVHSIGIDLTRFEPAPAALRSSAAVLFVGRLVEKKGCVHLVRCMVEVQRRVAEAHLVVIGDGPLRGDLQREAARLGVNASFLGAKLPPEVRAWMASARLLAAPSITAENGDAEGLPMVLCEALAMGLPVATFRSSGISELVRNEETGLLAEERDEGGLAENIIRLCQGGESLHGRLSVAGRACVEARFNLAAQTAVLESHYARVIREHRTDPEGSAGTGSETEAAKAKSCHACG